MRKIGRVATCKFGGNAYSLDWVGAGRSRENDSAGRVSMDRDWRWLGQSVPLCPRSWITGCRSPRGVLAGNERIPFLLREGGPGKLGVPLVALAGWAVLQVQPVLEHSQSGSGPADPALAGIDPRPRRRPPGTRRQGGGSSAGRASYRSVNRPAYQRARTAAA